MKSSVHEPVASEEVSDKLDSPCPMARRRASEAFDALTAERMARIEEWEAWEATQLEEDPLLSQRLYSPGEANEGEEFCDGSEDYQYCNKIHGPWGDSIPQNETYCLWAILEFQDPLFFGWGVDEGNTSAFNGIFQATIGSVIPFMEQGQVMYIGATGGVAMNESHSVPWPTASIIWADGNKYGKGWIEGVHRAQQSAGYGFGFAGHVHFKAVVCDEVDPMLAKHGLFNESTMEDMWTAERFVSGTYGFRNYWNAFAEMEDHSPTFYDAARSCTLAPCPLESGTDVESDGDAENLMESDGDGDQVEDGGNATEDGGAESESGEASGGDEDKEDAGTSAGLSIGAVKSFGFLAIASVASFILI
ncbi:hypothetical protein SEMRO_201_G085070.1 [Seminavis robusta]|uniref:Uncharacterized protein n=1 Tax=Seminavis robusta TaxID=568900 RepID=A0A9N8DK25_9STRA|nr:hypothetical protein SEMRO_201_G085070.1 [Seminavis robusta]|eukprot:Sro201_g085070.1 n/a (362) ;mRNA; r:47062-48278